MRDLLKALAWTAVIVAVSRCGTAAHALEPCHEEGPNVVCPKPSFERLVQRTIDFETAAKLCSIDLKSCQSERDDLQRRLDDALAIPCPPAPPPPRAIAPALGYVIGGAGLLAASLMPLMPGVPVEWRIATAAVGATAVGAGALLVVPIP